MALPVVLSRRAEADLDRLEAFIAAESPGRAERAITHLRQGTNRLARFPGLGVSLGKGTRQLYVSYGKSGYVVRYRVLPNAVLIVRIWHGKEHRPR